jgi:inner membrane protein involved in colicin E2 resistance
MKKIFTLMIAAAVVFAACSKDESIDPKQQKIEELMAQEKQQAAEVRAAVVPATTQPYNIQEWFWANFNDPRVSGVEKYSQKNLLDSAKTYILIVDGSYIKGKIPEDVNPVNMLKLRDKAAAYLATVDELNQLQK